MLKLQPTFSLKKLGVPVFAAGLTLLFAPLSADANELGDKNLSAGDDNAQVEDLQELLKERDLLEEEDLTGEFDDTTVHAIESFQEEHNLQVDGIAGPHTIGALDILTMGDEGKPVKTLQEKLKKLGFYEDDTDGVFESSTDEAVRDFQKSADILVDGLAGPQTFGALIQEFKEDEEPVDTEKEAPQQPKESTKSQVATDQSSDAEGRTLSVNATAYTAECTGCSGITATGVNLNNDRNAKVIAVDPNVIPLGSKVHIEGYGTYTAADTGGAINGNRIDIHMPTRGQALDFGRRSLEVTILN